MLGKTAYICSPYRAVTEKQFKSQIEYTKQISRNAVMQGCDVIVPHLYYPQFLDDNIEAEREWGMNSALNLILVCDFIIVGEEHGISSGMEAEIEFAKKHGISIQRV